MSMGEGQRVVVDLAEGQKPHDGDNLPEPADSAKEIIEKLEAGLASFRAVLAQLNVKN